ncbi:MAG: LacI family DNA-binding transcriptional regulator [Pseudomonadota bacterium]
MAGPETSQKAPSGVGKVKGRNRVTMTDIARAAGCSQPTVSFVLSNNEGAKISKAMRARVLEAARQLGYVRTDRQALNGTYNLQSAPSASGPIAFVVDNLASSPEAVHAFDGVVSALKATGRLVILIETSNDPELEPKALNFLLETGVSAIIYACIFTRLVELPKVLAEAEVPVYLLNCYTDPPSFPSVVPGEVAGGHAATAALLREGHKRIGVITGEMFMEAAGDRLQGYRNALATADLPYDDDLVVEGNWLPSSGYEGTQALMSLPNPPTAIFCQNDRMAVGCYEALKERGLKIPEDISVIGYDDDELARHLSPPLTSMNLASRALGRWVIEHLLHGPVSDAQRHPLTKLECELVERDSICAPKFED